MAKQSGIRYDVKIMHPKVNGGTVETFEEAIGQPIASLVPETFYVRTKIGALPIVTYDYLRYTSNSVVLEAIKCKSCGEYVIMTTRAVIHEDITICPVCNKKMF